jgi:hypothetical protein
MMMMTEVKEKERVKLIVLNRDDDHQEQQLNYYISNL